MQVFKCIQFHEKYTVGQLAQEIGMTRYAVYRALISLQYRNIVKPIPNTYPTVWKYMLGAEY